ncbi:unnamed protein product [Vicia faba]|uniref:Uncharacterized protein n=1 Tax=Vicia faba TaxID=3906 RepID=A0AAV0YNY5_VICFA|nr:unnamed protein product [Vicia faba]
MSTAAESATDPCSHDLHSNEAHSLSLPSHSQNAPTTQPLPPFAPPIIGIFPQHHKPTPSDVLCAQPPLNAESCRSEHPASERRASLTIIIRRRRSFLPPRSTVFSILNITVCIFFCFFLLPCVT